MSYIFSRQKTIIQKIESILFSAGVQSLILFRLSSFFNKFNFFVILRIPLLFYRLNQMLCNIDISPGAAIGKSFLMPHATGIVIGETSIIGDNVTIMQNVTIGTRRMGEIGKRHATIGNNVFIGPNAVILGNITIGNNSTIGANSLVLADVGENQKIFGVYK